MDIFVKGLQFVGKHGVYEEERRDGRRFKVDLSISMTNNVEIIDEKLDTTVDYRKIANIVLKHGEGPSVQLIETLIERIINDLFSLSPRVYAVDITLHKRATGVPGDPEWVGVHVIQSR